MAFLCIFPSRDRSTTHSFDADMDDRDQALEDISQWIDNVIFAFCEENGIREKYMQFKEEFLVND